MNAERAGVILGLASALSAGAASAAQVQAPFIDGSYTMSAAACEKFKAIAAGAPRNVSSVPWSVSAKGFDSGEGGCTFSKVTERRKGKAWAVTARCSEHGPRNPPPESYVFTRTGAKTFSVRLTTPGVSKADARPVVYTRCETAPAGKSK